MTKDEFLTKRRITIDGSVTHAGLLFFGKNEYILRYVNDFRVDYFEIPHRSIEK